MRRDLIEAVRTIIDTLTQEERDVLNSVSAARLPELTERSVVEAIAQAGGNVTRAASILGIARRTLQNRMREFNIDVATKGGRPKL